MWEEGERGGTGREWEVGKEWGWGRRGVGNMEHEGGREEKICTEKLFS